ncbi:Zn(II)2Cys6 transcription factor [Aspergillus undulatus]|uniref:Zn(II)2Cys6 transcription factor n=1 Tax=Aspergillus undulatus TaxID=1810928 RepID=UPI003CCCB187
MHDSLTCRERRVKCDDTKPECVRCTKSGRVCRYGQDKKAEGPRRRASTTNDPGTVQTVQDVQEQPSIDSAPYISAPSEASVPLHLNASIETSQDDLPDNGNDQGPPSLDPALSASPLALSQISLLNISPFDWYDLLAQDAIARWNFPGISLSRRPSPAPERLEPHFDQIKKPSEQRQLGPQHAGEGIETPLLDYRQVSEPWNTQDRIELSAVDIMYLRYYTEVVGPILDLFDPERHFTNVVPHLGLRNTGLLKSILAVGAKHMSLGAIHAPGGDMASDHMAPSAVSPASLAVATNRPSSEPGPAPAHMATHYYYETLQYLSQTLLYPSYADSREILATSIMISTYEMFDADRASTSGDWERHLRGSFWIQRSQDNDGESADGLRRAVWWAWVRQDIWAAFQTGRPTLTIWRARKSLEELNSDELATRIIYICAKCVEFAASEKTLPNQDPRQRIEQGDRLLRLLEDWHRALPTSYQPVTVATDTGNPRALKDMQIPSATPDLSSWNGQVEPPEHSPKLMFPSIWIHPPNHAGAMQMYHFAKAVVLLNQPTMGGLNTYCLREKQLSESVQTVCGIANACQEHEFAIAFVNVQTLFGVGQFVQSPELRVELLRTLEKNLRISKFPARGLIAQLQKVWQGAAGS